MRGHEERQAALRAKALAVPTSSQKHSAIAHCQWMLLAACAVLVFFGWYWPAALATMFSVGFSLGKIVQRWIDSSGKHIG